MLLPTFTRQHKYGSRAKEYNDDIEIRGYACERLFIVVDLNHVWSNACECSTIRDKTPLLAGKSVKANRVEVVWSWASYRIRIKAGCACVGNAGNVFLATADKWSRHASRHVRDARAVMHASFAN